MSWESEFQRGEARRVVQDWSHLASFRDASGDTDTNFTRINRLSKRPRGPKIPYKCSQVTMTKATLRRPYCIAAARPRHNMVDSKRVYLVFHWHFRVRDSPTLCCRELICPIDVDILLPNSETFRPEPPPQVNT